VTALLVALGAAVGVPVRFALSEWLDDDFPLGTLVVNVVGSGLLGLFSGLAPGESAAALLGTGFCGGMTTYSAFAVQTHRVGPVYAVLTIGLSLAACALGFWVGQA
jgi:CrcB protein